MASLAALNVQLLAPGAGRRRQLAGGGSWQELEAAGSTAAVKRKSRKDLPT